MSRLLSLQHVAGALIYSVRLVKSVYLQIYFSSMKFVFLFFVLVAMKIAWEGYNKMLVLVVPF